MNDKKITPDKQKPKNEPNLEKAAALLMAALEYAERAEDQAAMLEADSDKSRQGGETDHE